MPTKTKIEWCDYVSNPIKAVSEVGPFAWNGGHIVQPIGWACVKISAGCANCWASTFNVRLGTRLPYTTQSMKLVELFLDAKELERLEKWQPKGPFKNGRSRALVFMCDMTDLFGDWVPVDYLKAIFRVIETRRDVDFVLLTKRPERMLGFLAGAAPLANVILGVSVEDNDSAKRRWEPFYELHRRGWKTMVSYEPALGFVDWDNMYTWIDWLICGGESGSKARPMHPWLPRQARAICVVRNIRFFFKQWGEFAPVDDLVRAGMTKFKSKPVELWGGEKMVRVGKGLAGHLLDGLEWRETI